jgi:hypothetical protein
VISHLLANIRFSVAFGAHAQESTYQIAIIYKVEYSRDFGQRYNQTFILKATCASDQDYKQVDDSIAINCTIPRCAIVTQ